MLADLEIAFVHDLRSALIALGMEGRNFGEFTLTVVIYDQDRIKVAHAVAEFQKLFTQHLLVEQRAFFVA